jgi:hypothetical protein
VALVQRFIQGSRDVRLDVLDAVIVQRDLWSVQFFFAALGSHVSQLRIRTLRTTAVLAVDPRVAQLVLVALLRQRDRRSTARELLGGLLVRPDAADFCGAMKGISPLLIGSSLIVDTLVYFATAMLDWHNQCLVYDRATHAAMVDASSRLFHMVDHNIDPIGLLSYASCNRALQLLLLARLLDGANAVEQEAMLGIVFTESTVAYLRDRDEANNSGVDFHLPADATPDFACRTWLTFARHAWNLVLDRALDGYMRVHGMVEQAQSWLLAEERSLPCVNRAALVKEALRARQLYQ